MAFGIDFGTTNSATVEWGRHETRYYGASAGRPYPSLLAIDTLTGAVVARGEAVQKLLEEGGKKLEQCEIISTPKLLLGSDYARRFGDRLWYTKDFAREIFRGLSEVVEKRGVKLSEAVVAVPVNFAARKRREIRQGAEEAGVKIAGFISEPTAALYKNRETLCNMRKLVVFDWGGGTLDIALLDIDANNEVTELDAIGVELGGSHLDKKIAGYLYPPVQKDTGIAWNDLSSAQQYRFILNCEHAKIGLSREERKYFVLPEFINGYVANAAISRQEMFYLLQTEREQAGEALQHIVRKNRLQWSDIGAIIMVGGSSKLYGLKDYIEDISEVCKVILPGEEADWAVAHGAALLAENPGTYKISSNIGLRLANGQLFPLYQNGDVVKPGDPSSTRTLNFGIVEDSTTAVFRFARWNDAANPEDIGVILAKCNGFVDEALTLEYDIEPDLDFKAEIKSFYDGELQEQEFHYDNVLFRYKI